MTDSLVRTAIDNWAPRFTANGVPAADFAAITARIDRWEHWCREWVAGAATHLDIAEEALAGGRGRSAAEAFATAAACAHFAKYLFVDSPEEARAAHAVAVDAATRALPLLDPPGRRVVIADERSPLVGVLRVPAGPGPHPTVVLVPGLDSAKEEFMGPFGGVESAFLDRGLATLSLDGPGQGETEWQQPIRPDWEVVGSEVTEHLAGLDEVDADRIGVWGVSLGGYYAARIASDPGRVRAVVSLSGPYDFGEAWGGLNPLTKRAFRVRSGATSDDDAAERAAGLSMGGRASRIRVPMLVVAGARDRLFPLWHGTRLHDEATGPKELMVLDDGNHGCANVVYRHRPYSADWMAAQLGRAA